MKILKYQDITNPVKNSCNILYDGLIDSKIRSIPTNFYSFLIETIDDSVVFNLNYNNSTARVMQTIAFVNLINSSMVILMNKYKNVENVKELWIPNKKEKRWWLNVFKCFWYDELNMYRWFSVYIVNREVSRTNT